MKDKNASKNLLIALLYLACFISGVLNAAFSYGGLYSLILNAAGLVVTWCATALFHECGHLIVAKGSKFEVVKFSVLGITYDKTKKKRFSFGFSSELGEIVVIPQKVSEDCENGNAYARIMLGGIIGHIAAVVLYAVIALTVQATTVKAFFAFAPLSLATLIINGVAGLIPDSDATLLKSCSDNGGFYRYDGYLNILRLSRDGLRYADMYESYFVSENADEPLKSVLRLFDLKREEELGNLDNARLKAETMLEDEVCGVELLAELAFVGYVTGSDELIRKYGRVLEKLDLIDEPFSHRLRLARAWYDGDTAYFDAAYRTALKACEEEYFVGDGEFNKKMIERLR